MSTFQIIFIALYFLGAFAIIAWDIYHDFKDIEWEDK